MEGTLLMVSVDYQSPQNLWKLIMEFGFSGVDEFHLREKMSEKSLRVIEFI